MTHDLNDLMAQMPSANTTVFLPFDEALDMPDDVVFPVNDDLVAVYYEPLKAYLAAQKAAKKVKAE